MPVVKAKGSTPPSTDTKTMPSATLTCSSWIFANIFPVLTIACSRKCCAAASKTQKRFAYWTALLTVAQSHLTRLLSFPAMTYSPRWSVGGAFPSAI